MNERYIYLQENFFEGSLSVEEEKELNDLLFNNPELQFELNEQKRIKDVLKKMSLKNPDSEVWDKYWLDSYNKIERGIAWLFVSIGAIIFIAFGAYYFVDIIFDEKNIHPVLKFGISASIFGGVILVFSVAREKFLIGRSDKYKGIQR